LRLKDGPAFLGRCGPGVHLVDERLSPGGDRANRRADLREAAGLKLDVEPGPESLFIETGN